VSAAIDAPLALLLRAPEEVARRCREDDRLRPLAATSLVAILGGAAAFGATLGTFHGGLQILSASAKIPLAVATTLAIATPAFYALAAAAGRTFSVRTCVALVLAALARASLLLLATAPLVWLAIDLGLGYHASALLAALCYAAAGLVAFSLLVRGLGEGRGRVLASVAFVVLLAGVGAQTAWSLRPFLVRPRTTSVPFVRHREGSFADALVQSGWSSAGVYRELEVHSKRATRLGERAATPATRPWLQQNEDY